MKVFIVFLLSMMMLSASDGQTKKKAAPAKRTPAKVEIPAGAVQDQDGTYHYTDAQGKKWFYRKTPFGVARGEDKPSPSETAGTADHYDDVRATEDGDLIRFERKGPFGVYKWERKKSELNDMERTVWTRERAKSPAKQD